MRSAGDPSTHNDQGKLVVIAAPSGAGKTSLVRALLDSVPQVRFSVSYTTREPRAGEVDGRDYFFVSRQEFEAMVTRGAFLEHATVFGNRYGTARAEVAKLTDAGHDVLLEIDWQGARQVRAARPDCVSVYILPPSLAELDRRLRGRSTDSEATIQRRLSEARDDMAHWHEFDFAVINDRFDEALEDLKSILGNRADRLRTDDPGCRRRVERVMA
jgi:guanylate kinase